MPISNRRPLALGQGQDITNVTASRALGVTYTNTTGRTISVYSVVRASSGTIFYHAATVNGEQVADSGTSAATTAYRTSINFDVPPVGTYSVHGSNITLVAWRELRD